MSRRLSVLVVVHGPIAERMSAPEIRGLEMARTLAERHDVALATPNGTGDRRDGVLLLPSGRRRIAEEARGRDVLVAPRVPPWLLAALAGRDTLVVADLYNPFEAERHQLANDPVVRSELAVGRLSQRLQLEFADVVLCAVEPQRAILEAELAALAGARARRPDRPLLRVVPFGIGEDPPPATRRPWREHFPQIGADDVLVLWWGNVWRWFDAVTALRALARVVEDRPDVRLVFTAGRHPVHDRPELNATSEAREEAARLGLLDRHAFFLEEWIAQDVRHEYLLEADIGLTLARDARETTTAARGRYMDYLWAGLPCVLGADDALSERFAAAGFASTVRAGDVEGAAAALRALVDDPSERARRAEAGRALVAEFRWRATVAPLVDALDEIAGTPPARAGRTAALAAGLATYAGRRARHQALVVRRARSGATTTASAATNSST